ncbi:hypothetical protein LR48_Vigan11g098900 [Vigna angularis]|uniref:Uncharacterized protein n=1 Tax=Phaseolus angularis TaxID=3914 RepID=A0A0L9VSC3_PHAAN|nr:hypothetical protein LR48_Vigan11g098900 [Vigna angularis]
MLPISLEQFATPPPLPPPLVVVAASTIGRHRCLHHWPVKFLNSLFRVFASISLARTTMFVVAISRSSLSPAVRHPLRPFVAAFGRSSSPSTVRCRPPSVVSSSSPLSQIKRKKTDFE